MVLGDDEEITVEDAIKAFHKASPGPNILGIHVCTCTCSVQDS